MTFSQGLIPSSSDWQNQFDTVYNLVNGQLDSANVDKTSSDGIMVLDTAQTRTAALTMSAAKIAFTGNISESSWTTTGVVLSAAAATYTDSSTAGSGTAATATFASFAQPTLAATNSSVTTTDAATVYIAAAPTAGTNQTITNSYSLWVDAGASRFDGTINAQASVAIDLTTNGNRIDLDADNDTSIRASADDVITVEAGGQDLFSFENTSNFALFTLTATSATNVAPIIDLKSAASSTSSAHGIRWKQGSGNGDANNMGYELVYDGSNGRLFLNSQDSDGASTSANVWRIPDGQLTIDANTTWDDNVFDYVCDDCGWHDVDEPEKAECPSCGGKVEWHDDMELVVTALAKPTRTEGLRRMEKLGIVNTYGTLDSANPEVFTSLQNAHMFTLSAMGQMYRGFKARIEALERKVA